MNPTRSGVLKTVLYVLGCLSAVGFLITKSRTASAWVTVGDYRYGDLYRFAHIRRFKPTQPLPVGPEGNSDSIDQGKTLTDADEWILLGDSFAFVDWGEFPFHVQLSRKLGVPMFSVFNNNHEDLFRNPYLLFESRTNGTVPKLTLVYAIAERQIDGHFSGPIMAASTAGPGVMAASKWVSIKKVEDILLKNTEARHELLFKHSFITSPLVTLWNSAVFECFRQLPEETPWASLEPPFLFFSEETVCFATEHGDQLITKLADNIALLDESLRERYNCTLVFVPIPNKVTVYSGLATDQPYDQFIPRLCSALKSRRVCTVELLPRFRSEQEILYWPTDTHWNNLGIRTAVDETLRQLPMHQE